MPVISADRLAADLHVPVLVVGAGACGLCAALAVRDSGQDVLVLERDRNIRGNTSLSSGLIPAAGSRLQKSRGVVDSPEAFIADIVKKTRGETDLRMVEHIARESAETVDWMVEKHGVGLSLLEGFLYPGQSVPRMHGTKNRNGAELHAQLQGAAERAGVDISTGAKVTDLHVGRDRRVAGVTIERPEGSRETVGCDALILACNGFGGNRELVKKFIPHLLKAEYFGHPGNQGDAVIWAEELGAAVADMASFQGHGAVGHPSGVPMWNTITINGIQLNLNGDRFSNESSGYSEQALRVLAQPEGLVWNIFDSRGHEVASQYTEYRDGLEIGAVRKADTIAELSEITKLPEAKLTAVLNSVVELANGKGTCPFGRDFTKGPPLEPPYYAGRVTGAFFHTQGGLVVDRDAAVLDQSGRRFPNLFAGGGAARGISGPSDWGYLSGNGLLTATTLGRLAGRAAASVSKTT